MASVSAVIVAFSNEPVISIASILILCQPTTDKQHSNAHRFYEKLGFSASHEGIKIGL